MRSPHASLMALGTAALALGALACTHDVGTAPMSASAPTYAKGTTPGKVRTFHGRSATYDIDHDRALVKDRRSGREVRLARAQVTQLEKSYDRIVAMQGTVEQLRKDPAFGKAMQRAAKSPRQARLRIDPPASRSSALAMGVSAAVSAGTVQVAASGDNLCTELELQIYYGTQELDETVASFDNLMSELLTLGWGFDPSGAYGFDPVRYVTQFGSWVLKVDQLAYRISAIRTVLGYLAMQYDLAGCWYQGPGGGEATEPSDCRYEQARIEVLKDGVWVTTWEGTVKVCGKEE